MNNMTFADAIQRAGYELEAFCSEHSEGHDGLLAALPGLIDDTDEKLAMLLFKALEHRHSVLLADVTMLLGRSVSAMLLSKDPERDTAALVSKASEKIINALGPTILHGVVLGYKAKEVMDREAA